ncbi:MAG: preprotein translocase subunit YajC [Elusimicrobia bacterium]|nr:preprotein translocase subunit YajC [Elusimicrobiota bacterium]
MNPSGPSFMSSLVPIALVFGIFYFLLIRPQQKHEKQRQAMLKALSKGDKIVTSGGIIGTVAAVNDGEVEVKIAENVKVKVLRSAVLSVVPEVPQPAQPPKQS